MQQFVLIVLTILELSCLELRKMCYAHFSVEKNMLQFAILPKIIGTRDNFIALHETTLNLFCIWSVIVG